ncbi:AtpZ/AtpI family protein [Flavivirga rizhaonensis]|uniref:AtpZ/AtpI family protein n=1 Tax=Flavivirga rizhaonensis TaxID=2559571 RepID=A0A4S1E006_9FLAO|nr:AtpZ/AtpI family protein [Flavivirga rizhaonensis]TGV03820.1 AtpZ/AtpI family protein [Flavivirga rizhaonensis]
MDNNSKKDQKPKKQLSNYARFSGIAIQMFAIIGVGTFSGVKLDEKFPNENNLYTIFMSLTSVIFAIIFVIRRIIAASKNN